MKVKVGVMGSAEAARSKGNSLLTGKATALGRTISASDVILLSGATTGLVYVVGKTAHEAGAFHVGVSPASNMEEHIRHYQLPIDACDLLIFTGFGLKGRNVVLVRSCDIVIFIAGAMGSLNEFTIAHDEGKIIGCLTCTGGVADEAHYLVEKFSKQAGAQVIEDNDPESLMAACLLSLSQRTER